MNEDRHRGGVRGRRGDRQWSGGGTRRGSRRVRGRRHATILVPENDAQLCRRGGSVTGYAFGAISFELAGIHRDAEARAFESCQFFTGMRCARHRQTETGRRGDQERAHQSRARVDKKIRAQHAICHRVVCHLASPTFYGSQNERRFANSSPDTAIHVPKTIRRIDGWPDNQRTLRLKLTPMGKI